MVALKGPRGGGMAGWPGIERSFFLQLGSDDEEVGRREIQIWAQPCKMNGCFLSGAVGVIGQDPAIGIVDDAVIGVMSDARRTLVKCAQGKSAVAAHGPK